MDYSGGGGGGKGYVGPPVKSSYAYEWFLLFSEADELPRSRKVYSVRSYISQYVG